MGRYEGWGYGLDYRTQVSYIRITFDEGVKNSPENKFSLSSVQKMIFSKL